MRRSHPLKRRDCVCKPASLNAHCFIAGSIYGAEPGMLHCAGGVESKVFRTPQITIPADPDVPVRGRQPEQQHYLTADITYEGNYSLLSQNSMPGKNYNLACCLAPRYLEWFNQQGE